MAKTKNKLRIVGGLPYRLKITKGSKETVVLKYYRNGKLCFSAEIWCTLDSTNDNID